MTCTCRSHFHTQKGTAQRTRFIRFSAGKTGCPPTAFTVICFRKIGKFEISGESLNDLVGFGYGHPGNDLDSPLLKLYFAGEVMAGLALIII
jgi:hypothetical protein